MKGCAIHMTQIDEPAIEIPDDELNLVAAGVSSDSPEAQTTPRGGSNVPYVG
jgi:hypothetical protein